MSKKAMVAYRTEKSGSWTTFLKGVAYGINNGYISFYGTKKHCCFYQLTFKRLDL